jgi:hypothetical protein
MKNRNQNTMVSKRSQAISIHGVKRPCEVCKLRARRQVQHGQKAKKGSKSFPFL